VTGDREKRKRGEQETNRKKKAKTWDPKFKVRPGEGLHVGGRGRWIVCPVKDGLKAIKEKKQTSRTGEYGGTPPWVRTREHLRGTVKKGGLGAGEKGFYGQ